MPAVLVDAKEGGQWEQTDSHDARLLGRKAFGLCRLPAPWVPSFLIVSSDAFRTAIEQGLLNDLVEAVLLRGSTQVEGLGARLEQDR